MRNRLTRIKHFSPLRSWSQQISITLWCLVRIQQWPKKISPKIIVSLLSHQCMFKFVIWCYKKGIVQKKIKIWFNTYFPRLWKQTLKTNCSKRSWGAAVPWSRLHRLWFQMYPGMLASLLHSGRRCRHGLHLHVQLWFRSLHSQSFGLDFYCAPTLAWIGLSILLYQDKSWAWRDVNTNTQHCIRLPQHVKYVFR